MNKILALLLVTLCAVAQAQPVYRCENGRGDLSYQDKPCTPPPEASNIDDTRQQGIQQTLDVYKPPLGLKTTLKPLNDPKATEYSDNNRRCQNALRITELCGKFAGDFSCDARGFHHESAADVSVFKSVSAGKISDYNIGQCALRAANGGF
jgi:hypothetical protein